MVDYGRSRLIRITVASTAFDAADCARPASLSLQATDAAQQGAGPRGIAGGCRVTRNSRLLAASAGCWPIGPASLALLDVTLLQGDAARQVRRSSRAQTPVLRTRNPSGQRRTLSAPSISPPQLRLRSSAGAAAVCILNLHHRCIPRRPPGATAATSSAQDFRQTAGQSSTQHKSTPATGHTCCPQP